MYEIQIIDYTKPIITLTLSDIITKSEIQALNEELEEARLNTGIETFYFLVDTSALKVFAPDTKEDMIQQQKRFAPYIVANAFVITSSAIFVQLQESHMFSGKEKDKQFEDFESAWRYLQFL